MKYLRKILFSFIFVVFLFVFVPLLCFIVSKCFYLLADLFSSYEIFLRKYFTEFSAWFISVVTFVLVAGTLVFTIGELFDALDEDSKSKSKS